MNVKRELLDRSLAHLLGYRQALDFHYGYHVDDADTQRLDKVTEDLRKLLKVKVLKYKKGV